MPLRRSHSPDSINALKQARLAPIIAAEDYSAGYNAAVSAIIKAADDLVKTETRPLVA